MAKKENPKPGRFIHMDFPQEGIDETVDTLFKMFRLHAFNLEPVTHYQVKVSYTGMMEPRKEEEAPAKADGLRLVK